MASPTSGFNPNELQYLKNLDESQRKNDEEVLELCGKMKSLLSPPANDEQSPPRQNVNLSRKIQLPARQSLNREILAALADGYRADQQLADEICAGLDSTEIRFLQSRGMRILEATVAGEALERNAVREAIKEERDDFLSNIGVIKKTPLRLGPVNVTFTPKLDRLLQEFEKVCAQPNYAEVEMLGRAGRAPVLHIQLWFIRRQQAKQRLAVVRNWTLRNVPLAQEMHKKRYLATRRRLAPEFPPEMKAVL